MNSEQRKKLALAVNSIIRGLEHDEVEFRYDEAAECIAASVALTRDLVRFEDGGGQILSN